ncbi:MAG: WYL domain-containing protein [Candidatus Accumulibacter sp.]|nr:WYL domain-containing protein [Accumulibacter sp.]MCM8612439.1 WYL domain-containing protein [Accumulibacter sp.]MCM8636836.1 WYL domain-containing protein [Accumulibacter sp.]MCM8641161.1 WYL domain-containing protein [Accumulibacter sp.]
MNNMERIYQIDQILGARHCVTRKELQERLGVSWATLKRDLAYMRDRLNAPIRFDRNLGGYRFEKAGQRVGAHYELPGLWFSAEEIHALLTMHHLLSNLDTGGLLARLTGLLGSADNPAEEVQRRIRIQTVGARELHLDHFQSVGSALLRRKRLLIRYHARGTDEVTQREVSSQRLNRHRGKGYLDTRCHLRDGPRAFAVDAIAHAEVLDTLVRDVADQRLDEVPGSGYGLLSGERIAWAVRASRRSGRVSRRQPLRAACSLHRRPSIDHGHHEVRRRLRARRAGSAQGAGGCGVRGRTSARYGSSS